jgi:hypothetical protein
MSPALTVIVYVIAIVLFVLAAWGVTGLRRPIALGWLGVALVTLVLLVGAIEAL